MKALIVVAGYATRLYPLTKETPKALLQVGDKRMIEHVVEKLEKVPEIDEIHVVTNNKFYSHFSDWARGLDSSKEIIIHNDQTTSDDDKLGAVGDIHFGIKSAGIDEEVIVIGGDNLFDLELTELTESFRKHGKSIVAARELDDPEVLKKMGVIVPDENGHIRLFEEKPKEPKSNLAATMIYLINKENLSHLNEFMESGFAFDNAGEMIRAFSERSKVHCHRFDSTWFDVGSHEQLKEAHEHMLRKQHL